jgi:membrane-associated phospholipid phosphatase
MIRYDIFYHGGIKMKIFLKKYPQIKHIIIYFIFYMCFFLFLESRNNSFVFNSTTFIDKYIPFCEYFIVFYLLWFVYILFGYIYFLFIENSMFDKMWKYLVIGMTTCLIIDLIVPNGLNLRPVLQNENIFQSLVSYIYQIDTPTNVFPSIHVYDSIIICYGLNKSQLINKYKILKPINIFISVMICLSTVLLKQHAFLDVIGAIVLSYIIIKFVDKVTIAK